MVRDLRFLENRTSWMTLLLSRLKMIVQLKAHSDIKERSLVRMLAPSVL